MNRGPQHLIPIVVFNNIHITVITKYTRYFPECYPNLSIGLRITVLSVLYTQAEGGRVRQTVL